MSPDPRTGVACDRRQAPWHLCGCVARWPRRSTATMDCTTQSPRSRQHPARRGCRGEQRGPPRRDRAPRPLVQSLARTTLPAWSTTPARTRMRQTRLPRVVCRVPSPYRGNARERRRETHARFFVCLPLVRQRRRVGGCRHRRRRHRLLVGCATGQRCLRVARPPEEARRDG